MKLCLAAAKALQPLQIWQKKEQVHGFQGSVFLTTGAEPLYWIWMREWRHWRLEVFLKTPPPCGTQVHISFTHALHPVSPCTCWQELVIWNSLQGLAVKSLAGIGYSNGGKGRPREKKKKKDATSSPLNLIELSGFSPYQGVLISCHILARVCFYIRLWQERFR